MMTSVLKFITLCFYILLSWQLTFKFESLRHLSSVNNTWQRIFFTESGVATDLKKYFPNAVFLITHNNL